MLMVGWQKCLAVLSAYGGTRMGTYHKSTSASSGVFLLSFYYFPLNLPYFWQLNDPVSGDLLGTGIVVQVI